MAPKNRSGYLPLEPGNWWRYKWVEGEEKLGYRTEDRVDITSRHEDGAIFMQRYVTCIR